MKSPLVIGLDFGSDSVRGIVVDCANGQILQEAAADYPRWSQNLFCDSGHAQFRQHPQDYLDGMNLVVSQLLKNVEKERIVGMGLDTTGSTICAVDQEGTPLALREEFKRDPDAMFYLWKDHSSIAEADLINQISAAWHENYRRYSGNHYSCEWFWSKILHIIRTNPRVAQAAYSYVEHCDWMVGELTGNTNPNTLKRSRCAAGHKALWHQDWGGLPCAEFLRAIDPQLENLRSRLFKDTLTSDVSCGKLAPKWAHHWNLSSNVLVSGGQLDCHAGAVGAGIKPGKLIKVVGTSTCDILVAPGKPPCVKGICGQVDGSVVAGLIGFEAGQASFGDVYHWFQKFMNFGGSSFSIAQIEKAAAELPKTTQENIFALDWFNGRRSPDANEHLKGAICGLDLGTTPPQVFRALVEATCCGSRRIVERFVENDLAVDSITAVGGIPQKSAFVMQTMADILNKPIDILNSPQACALGSAMNSSVAAGIFPNVMEAAQILTPPCEKTYFPQTQGVERGEYIYRHYCNLAQLIENI